MMLKWLASTRLTLVGMLCLAVGAGLSYDNPATTSAWVLITPLGLLAINLFAAILSQPGINRRPGLLFFHIGLLGICVLSAIGQLSTLEGHVELSLGSAFHPSEINDVKQGPWHRGNISKVQFVQGEFTVDYSPRLMRGPTRSYVQVSDAHGNWSEKVVGDDTPLIIDGYRFYTTFNKGFAAVLTWTPVNGSPVTGAVHMPSYPLFEHKQDNRWTPPGESQELKLWLRLNTAYDPENAWVLDLDSATGVLVVNDLDDRVELSPGESVILSGGELRFDQITSWMGYKVFYDPTLKALFFSAILAVFGLFFHYWRKFSDQPMSQISTQ